MKTYPIKIDDETHLKLKKKCFEKNTTIKDVIDNAIEDFIGDINETE